MAIEGNLGPQDRYKKSRLESAARPDESLNHHLLRSLGGLCSFCCWEVLRTYRTSQVTIQRVEQTICTKSLPRASIDASSVWDFNA
jgi:hypothetical protein